MESSARCAFATMLPGWFTLQLADDWWTKELGISEFYPLGVEPMYPGLVVSALM
jgi:hypothetical protein